MKAEKFVNAAVVIILGFATFLLFAQTNNESISRKILYYTCPMHPSVKSDKPGNCPYCGMGLEPVYADDSATNAPSNGTNNAAAGTQPKSYPFDTCIVDGMKLGSMGNPCAFVYQGQEIKLCCGGCKPVFLNNPGPYMKKIQDAEAQK